MKEMTQKKAILQHLKQFGSITSWEAIKEYGATRLSALILILRRKGYNIETQTMFGKDRFGNYCKFAKYILMED